MSEYKLPTEKEMEDARGQKIEIVLQYQGSHRAGGFGDGQYATRIVRRTREMGSGGCYLYNDDTVGEMREPPETGGVEFHFFVEELVGVDSTQALYWKPADQVVTRRALVQYIRHLEDGGAQYRKGCEAQPGYKEAEARKYAQAEQDSFGGA